MGLWLGEPSSSTKSRAVHSLLVFRVCVLAVALLQTMQQLDFGAQRPWCSRCQGIRGLLHVGHPAMALQIFWEGLQRLLGLS